MTSIKIFFAEECRRIPVAPPTIQEFKLKIKEMLGVDNPLIQYRDEENDLITIQTQDEYQEPITSSLGRPVKFIVSHNINFASILASVPLCSSDKGHESDEDIELLSSETLEAEADAVELNFAEKSIETYKIECHDVSNLASLPNTTEQSSNTMLITEEKASSTLGFETIDQACNSKVETVDSGCDAKKFLSQNIETIPLSISNVQLETVEIPTIEKSSNTNKSKDKGIDVEMDRTQSVANMPATKDLLESLRLIIREEIENLDKLKLSGLQIVHQVECFKCKSKPIVGIRYKCQECGFSLCESCEDNYEHPHPFFKMRRVEEAKKPVEVQKPFPQPVKKAVNFEPVPQFKYPILDQPQKPIIQIDEVSNGALKFQRAKQLLDLGFTDSKKNLSALIRAKYNIDKAVEILLDE